MLSRGISGIHCTTASPGTRSRRGYSSDQSGHGARKLTLTSHENCTTPNDDKVQILSTPDGSSNIRHGMSGQTQDNDVSIMDGSHQQWPKLLVCSAADKNGIDRISEIYQQYLSKMSEGTDEFPVGDLAFTLASHKSHLAWRSFAIPQCSSDLSNFQSLLSPPIRIRPEEPRIAFVFTGQGAQWAGMGRELMSYSVFRQSLLRASTYLTRLGCTWDVTGK